MTWAYSTMLPSPHGADGPWNWLGPVLQSAYHFTQFTLSPHTLVLRNVSCIGPMCCPKGSQVSCCATLTDRATDSNAPVQLVYGHPLTNSPGVYVSCATSSLEIRPCNPVACRTCSTQERQRLSYVGFWLSSVLRPLQHSIGYMGDSFYRSKDPTNSIKVLKEKAVCWVLLGQNLGRKGLTNVGQILVRSGMGLLYAKEIVSISSAIWATGKKNCSEKGKGTFERHCTSIFNLPGLTALYLWGFTP